VHQIRNHTNEGHTRAVNQGIVAANGELILLLDADTIVRAGTVRALESFLKARPEVSIVAPRMFNGDGTLQETARDFPRPINGLFGRQSVLTRWFPANRFSKRYLRTDERERDEPFEVEWVSAACMMFRRSLPDRIGPWDEGFHSYWVDADWCMRAGRAGGLVFCDPRAEVVHYEQNRRGKRKSPARIVLFHRSVYRFYRKHYTFGVWDPRAVVAAIALALRAGLLVLGNALLPEDTPVPAARLNAEEEPARRVS
jgi:GT2 family glycosyltransferase